MPEYNDNLYLSLRNIPNVEGKFAERYQYL